MKVLQPSGILDSSTTADLRNQIVAAVDGQAKFILLDLKSIDFIDSSGLGALVSAAKAVRLAGGDLYICSLTNQVKMLFDLTRMDRIFTIFENQADCFAQIQGQ